METNLVDNKSCKIYFLVDNERIYFNADFDSGNVQKVQQVSPYVFKVHPGYDKTKNCSDKTFFHFKVYGLKMCTANFIVSRVNILQKLINTNQKNQMIPPYYPVYRKQNGPFKKVKRQVKKYYNCFDQPELSFSFEFDEDPYVQFAFTYPYSYEQCQSFIEELEQKYLNHSQIYFHNEILCLSQQSRNVRLITITDKQNCQTNKQEQIEGLFPYSNQRPFKVKKPVVFMSARVHPGESPSSYAVQGALKFLLNQNDCRSYLLRKNFLIKIIPMLNPDGVFHGMFRTDINGENLNRVYSQCNERKYPTIWSIKKYATWLKQHQNVLFYFDFHAHPSTKNFFIYGNSFNEISFQTEAQLFGKMIEFNCPYFQNFQSIYSEKEMKSKHKYDSYSKQGCARVFMHRTFNIIHSYTVECGYFGWTKLNQIQNREREEGLNVGDLIEDNQFQRIPQRCYEPDCYMLMGKSILITILDLFGLNPYPKKLKGQISTPAEIRKSCGNKIYHEVQTYKNTDANCYKKLSDLSSQIEQIYYNEKLKGTNLKLSTNENNTLLKDQLTYLNASPKTKQVMKSKRKAKPSMLSKSKDFKFQTEINFSQTISKVQIERIKNQARTKISQKQVIKTYHQQTKQTQYIPKYLCSNVKTLKFLYNDLERFNQNKKDSAQSKVHPASQKLLPTGPIISSYSDFDNNSPVINIDLPKIKRPANHNYNSALQLKEFVPQSRESKIKSTLEKSITLRKGSCSKMVMINKDELKFLRISNLVQKKLKREAISMPKKKFFRIKPQNQKQRQNLPSIKGKSKF